MPTEWPPRSADSVSCAIPDISVSDLDTLARGLLDKRPGRNDTDRLRSEALTALKSPCSSGDVRPRSPPMSWMTAVTDRVNSLWRSLPGEPTIPRSRYNERGGRGRHRQGAPPQEGLSRLGDNRLPNFTQGAHVDQVQAECLLLGEI